MFDSKENPMDGEDRAIMLTWIGVATCVAAVLITLIVVLYNYSHTITVRKQHEQETYQKCIDEGNSIIDSNCVVVVIEQ